MLDHVADIHGVSLAVAMAQNWITPAAGVYANVRPEHSRSDLDGRHLGDWNTFLRVAEETGLDAQHALWPHFNARGKEKITVGKAAGFKESGWTGNERRG